MHDVLGPRRRRHGAGLRQGVPDGRDPLRHEGGDDRVRRDEGRQAAGTRVRGRDALRPERRRRAAHDVRRPTRGDARRLRPACGPGGEGQRQLHRGDEVPPPRRRGGDLGGRDRRLPVLAAHRAPAPAGRRCRRRRGRAHRRRAGTRRSARPRVGAERPPTTRRPGRSGTDRGRSRHRRRLSRPERGGCERVFERANQRRRRRLTGAPVQTDDLLHGGRRAHEYRRRLRGPHRRTPPNPARASSVTTCSSGSCTGRWRSPSSR